MFVTFLPSHCNVANVHCVMSCSVVRVNDTLMMLGGSSGGEAALILAGGSPVGLGSDIGGLLLHSCVVRVCMCMRVRVCCP